MVQKNSGLGRGLDALLDTDSVQPQGASSISEIEISKIFPNPDQPRHTFNEEALEELAASIREFGVVSPITVRENTDGTYMIIAGERRWRASQRAGLTLIPAYIKKASDEQVMAMAMIENVQRENLDAIEIALGYQRLMSEYDFTQEKLSERIGKKRTTISNYLRLLNLPAEIQIGVKEKKIDMGHARALLGTENTADQIMLYKRIIKDGLSVRKVEDMVRDMHEDKSETKPSRTMVRLTEPIVSLQKDLIKKLGRKVRISQDLTGAGKLSIAFDTQEDLAQVLQLLNQ